MNIFMNSSQMSQSIEITGAVTLMLQPQAEVIIDSQKVHCEHL